MHASCEDCMDFLQCACEHLSLNINPKFLALPFEYTDETCQSFSCVMSKDSLFIKSIWYTWVQGTCRGGRSKSGWRVGHFRNPLTNVHTCGNAVRTPWVKCYISGREAFDDFLSRSQAGGPTVAHNHTVFTRLQSKGAIRIRMRLARKLAEKQKGNGATHASMPAENTPSTWVHAKILPMQRPCLCKDRAYENTLHVTL